MMKNSRGSNCRIGKTVIRGKLRKKQGGIRQPVDKKIKDREITTRREKKTARGGIDQEKPLKGSEAEF